MYSKHVQLLHRILLFICFDFILISQSLIWIKLDTNILPNGQRYSMITGSYNHSIYLIGGTAGVGGFSDIIEYNINTNDYTVHTDTVDSMAGSSIYTQINTVIYIYCSSTDYIVTYDMTSNTYNSQFVLKQNTNLEDPCVTNVNSEYLFVLGGYLDSTTTHNGFHIFNLLIHQWISDGPNMEEPRMYFTCQVHNNQLYVIGGSTYLWVNPVNTVSLIDISDMSNINQQNWNTLQDTLNGRIRNLNSVVYGNNIYVIGGYFGSSNNDAVNVIDTISNTIYVDSYLVSEISDTAAIVASGSIYAFGGSSDTSMSVSFMQYAVLPEIAIDITSHPSTAPTDKPITVQPSTSPSQSTDTQPPTGVPRTEEPSTSPFITSDQLPTGNPITVQPSTSPFVASFKLPTDTKMTANDGPSTAQPSTSQPTEIQPPTGFIYLTKPNSTSIPTVEHPESVYPLTLIVNALLNITVSNTTTTNETVHDTVTNTYKKSSMVILYIAASVTVFCICCLCVLLIWKGITQKQWDPQPHDTGGNDYPQPNANVLYSDDEEDVADLYQMQSLSSIISVGGVMTVEGPPNAVNIIIADDIQANNVIEGEPVTVYI